MGKTWKKQGPEDEFILQQLRERKINQYTTPKQLKERFPLIFGEYSDHVIRNHFNVIKRLEGTHLENPSVPNPLEEEEEFEAGPSFQGLEEMNRSSRPVSVPNPERSLAARGSGQDLNFSKYPHLVEVYKDPLIHVDKVFLAIGIPGGATHVALTLNANGSAAIVTYKWPVCLINMADLFQTEVATSQMSLYHPKVIAARNGLEKVTSNRHERPDASITIQLPIQVQTDDSTWKYKGQKRSDGTLLLTAEFRGHLRDFNRSVPNQFIEFENV